LTAGFNNVTVRFFKHISEVKLLIGFSMASKGAWLFLGSAVNDMIRHREDRISWRPFRCGSSCF